MNGKTLSAIFLRNITPFLLKTQFFCFCHWYSASRCNKWRKPSRWLFQSKDFNNAALPKTNMSKKSKIFPRTVLLRSLIQNAEIFPGR